MSKFHMQKAACPACGKMLEIKTWDSINSGINRELKEKILDGTIYDVKCPECDTLIHGVYGFLYHDMEGKYLIEVYNDYSSALSACGIPRDYRLRKVDNLWQLIEKIRIFDSGYNDIVMEIVKKIIYEQMKDEHELLFVEVKDGMLVFQIMDGYGERGVMTDIKIYDMALKGCQPGDLVEKYDFVEVNQDYVNQLLCVSNL